LSKINSPSDLKKLSLSELPKLSEELRNFIIDVVSTNPGHFAASLGVVELTVALHYIYNSPYDQLIWDVGHQAYGHKILTERRDVFHTNRKYKGISGFPKPSESVYDSFGVGHSSTSISAALGIAVASRTKGETNRKVVAIIGDGSLTGGMAFEGLNNAGMQNADLLVILNDNNMAIDPNVGGFKDYLTDIVTSKSYNKIKKEIWDVLGKFAKLLPDPRSVIQKFENSLKYMLLKHSNLFESMNFRYFGPVDGHDVVHLTKILKDLRDIPGPKLLHIITKKGKGFLPAEKDQTTFHAPGKFNKETGEIIRSEDSGEKPLRYQDVFGHTLLELARNNKNIVGITPAMPTGCSLNVMMKEIPDRTFDVGIAEQHAVTFSAGLAIQGMVPFCNIYSSFMQRAYDQVIHDVAIQNLNVVMCLDRGGLVGEDGATHHGVFDLAYFRCIPNITIASPMNEEELRNLMYTAQLENKGPFVIRYPRGRGVMKNWKTELKEIQVGKGRKIKEGNDIAILSIGHLGNIVSSAISLLDSTEYSVAHYDVRFLKPIDEKLLHEVCAKFDKIISVEDGTKIGGLGSAVLEFINEHHYKTQIKILGIPDQFIEQGTPEELYEECGLDANSISKTIIEVIKLKTLSTVL
ncbi:1-deoxy-D-xylulose-5-phosphate synthase, partial [Bacteroidota bacterium]